MDIYKHLKLTLSEEEPTVDESKDKKQERVLQLLKDANKELEKYYAGRFKFNISNGGKETPDDIKKISPKRKRKIKEI